MIILSIDMQEEDEPAFCVFDSRMMTVLYLGGDMKQLNRFKLNQVIVEEPATANEVMKYLYRRSVKEKK